MESKKIVVLVVGVVLVAGLIYMIWLTEQKKQDAVNTTGVNDTIKISKDQAIERAYEIARLSGLTESDIKEIEFENHSTGYVYWFINIGEEGTIYPCLTIKINAKTGELVFYSTDESTNEKRRIPEDRLIKIAIDFFNKYEITLPSDAKLKKIDYHPENTSVDLIWIREIEGIPYLGNDIILTILSNEHVDHFSKHWEEQVTSQKPKLTEEAAQKIAREKLGEIYSFKKEPEIYIRRLEYTGIQGKPDVRLCYYIVFDDGLTHYGSEIDAQTGELLWHDHT